MSSNVTVTLTHGGMSDSATGLRALARRHPIALYLAIVFGVGYPLMALPILASRGLIPGAGPGSRRC